MSDVFKFDPDAKTVTFHGDAGLELLYDLLLRAKFGDGYEKPLLVSPWLAKLLKQLDVALPDDGQWFPERPGQPIFDTDDLLAMGDAVIEEGHTVGWWTMTEPERADLSARDHRRAASADRPGGRVHRSRHRRGAGTGAPPGRGRFRTPGSAGARLARGGGWP
jgi:hypothetical protein